MELFLTLYLCVSIPERQGPYLFYNETYCADVYDRLGPYSSQEECDGRATQLVKNYKRVFAPRYIAVWEDHHECSKEPHPKHLSGRGV